mmetsp:Transcript_24552/g.52900  ORF Transcript_24552/g.52900 Transcript_24552/m.52900 type:complete len:205 (+) Transcript_24552:167-781(+)
MISLCQNEMACLSKPVQVLERHLLNWHGLYAQILHREHLVLLLLSCIPLCRHFREVILSHQVDHIRCQHGTPVVLENICSILDNLRGNIRQDWILPGDIVNEFRQLCVRIVLWTEAINTTSLELFRVVNDAVDRLGHVVDPYWLSEGVSSVHERDHREPLANVGIPIKQLILVSKHLRRTDNGCPRIRLEHLLLPLVLPTCPLA